MQDWKINEEELSLTYTPEDEVTSLFWGNFFNLTVEGPVEGVLTFLFSFFFLFDVFSFCSLSL